MLTRELAIKPPKKAKGSCLTTTTFLLTKLNLQT